MQVEHREVWLFVKSLGMSIVKGNPSFLQYTHIANPATGEPEIVLINIVPGHLPQKQAQGEVIEDLFLSFVFCFFGDDLVVYKYFGVA